MERKPDNKDGVTKTEWLSRRITKKLGQIAKEAIKKQFDKKKRNLQGLKARDNVWLKSKNIHSKWFSKKLDQKRYRPLKISKDISWGVF